MNHNSRAALSLFIAFITSTWIFFLGAGILIMLRENELISTKWGTELWGIVLLLSLFPYFLRKSIPKTLFLTWCVSFSTAETIFLSLHKSYENYLRVIQQPYPLSELGSTPFQLIVYLGFIGFGICMFLLSFFFQNHE